MRKNLSPSIIGLVGVLFLGSNLIFDGVILDLLAVAGTIFIIVALIGIFRKKKEPEQN